MRGQLPRLLALVLLWWLCISPAGGQVLTDQELATELQAISALLATARVEYATVSSELQSTRQTLSAVQTVVSTLRDEAIPLLTTRLDALQTSYTDYRREVDRRICVLRGVTYVSLGVALVAGILAIVGWVT